MTAETTDAALGELMSDFEPEPATPGRAAPSVAFDGAMVGVETRCGDLTALLDSDDLQRVAHVARSAVNQWLAGRSAYRRLVERDRDASPHVVAARQRLDATHLVLVDLLERIRKQARDQTTRSRIDDAWIGLVTAAATPIDDDPPSTATTSSATNARKTGIDD